MDSSFRTSANCPFSDVHFLGGEPHESATTQLEQQAIDRRRIVLVARMATLLWHAAALRSALSSRAPAIASKGRRMSMDA